MFLEETCCKTSPEHIHTSKSFGNRSPKYSKHSFHSYIFCKIPTLTLPKRFLGSTSM